MTRHVLFAAALFFVALTPFSQANAQVTPNQVYQVTDTIMAELSAFYGADFAEPPKIEMNLAERKPRHVLQKAQEVFTKVQTLRGLKGLTVNPVESIPVQDATPADVKAAVDNVLKNLKDLDSVYGIDPVAEAALPTDKTPTDAYMNLARISVAIDGLGIPATVPNDVHRIAETIVGDLLLIVKKKGLNENPTFESGASGKVPADVYAEAHALLAKIKTLTDKADYTVPGGVTLLNKETVTITPAYVMDALGNVLAEVGAIKNKVGVTEPTKIADLQSGKTPSDAFDSIKHAEALVDVLLAGGAAE